MKVYRYTIIAIRDTYFYICLDFKCVISALLVEKIK